MGFHFDVNKVVQCAGYLLAKYPDKKHNYTCIIKMLYLADRVSLEEQGVPITGDSPVAMPNGPVLSSVYDLIRGRLTEEDQAIWERYIETEQYDIALILDSGDGKLSDYEVGVLDKIHIEYGEKSFGELIAATHNLQEWIESYTEGTSTRVSLRTRLNAVGRGDDYDEISLQRIEAAHFATLFGK